MSMVIALGTTLTISWGSLFYAIGVLGPQMTRDLRLHELTMFGSFTVGLVVSGLCAPHVGRLVDERGGRWVMAHGSLLGAVAMGILAAAVNDAMVLAGWILGGIAMSAVLYDPAFATVSQNRTLDYRKTVTTLTLMGALASTIFWPVASAISAAWGWRVAWAVLAVLQLALCWPLHRRFIVPPRPPVPERAAVASPGAATPAGAPPTLRWISIAFAVASFVFSVCVVHVIDLLQKAGLSQGEAVALAMLIGPLQVVGRLLELRLSRSASAVTLGFSPFVLIVVALFALPFVDGVGFVAVVFVATLGFGNGILTIARGTVPQEIFGNHRLGELLGRVARLSLFARALAPASLSGMAAAGWTHGASLWTLFGVACAGVGCYAFAVRRAPVPPPRG